MPPKHDKPLKTRTYKLSDETVEILQRIADVLTESTGIKCGMTDALRIAVNEKAAAMGLKTPKKK
jgi:hypothetical protein